MRKLVVLLCLCHFTSLQAAPVIGLGYEAIASVSGSDDYNGLSDGALTFSGGWDFPGLLALDLFYKKFTLENDIEKPNGILRAKMDALFVGPMVRIHHGPYIDSRLSLFYSKLESDYTLPSGQKAVTDQDGTHLGILVGGEGHFKFWSQFETYLGCDLMRLGGEILSLSLDLGLRWYVNF